MSTPKKRLFITAKDIEIITGYKQKTSYKILDRIRLHYGKEKHHAITFTEFYEYFGIPEKLR
jgi:hypothetical protein